jgi:hypothetical protein
MPVGSPPAGHFQERIMRTADLLQFNLRLLLRQRCRTLMSLLANDAGGLTTYRPFSGANHAHR